METGDEGPQTAVANLIHSLIPQQPGSLPSSRAGENKRSRDEMDRNLFPFYCAITLEDTKLLNG